MENIKIGIVIQGSLVSQGIDCVNNCNELVDIYSKSPFVSKTVLSTWEGEDTELIDKRAVVLKSRPVLGEDIRNRQKQFLSTFEGVKFLKNNSDVTHILKLRTDQFVPIEIIDEIVLIYKKDQYDCKFFSQPLTFCYINRTIPFHIGDFFFAGKVSDMYKFLFNILS